MMGSVNAQPSLSLSSSFDAQDAEILKSSLNNSFFVHRSNLSMLQLEQELRQDPLVPSPSSHHQSMLSGFEEFKEPR